MTIDWAKPLELMDGTPVRLRETGFRGGPNPDADGDYWVCLMDGSDAEHCVFPANGIHRDHIFVRNRAEPETVTPDEIPEWVKVGEIAKSSVTLRDRFAMAALGGVFRHTTKQDFDDADSANNFIVEAGIAYKIADAMLDARNG